MTVVAILAVSVGSVLWIVAGVAIALAIWKFGIGMLRALSRPPIEPPEPGQLRKVNLRYRCDVCGVELRLTVAPDDDPPPPKHCLEEMVVVAPLYD